jgi:hypothetical protein
MRNTRMLFFIALIIIIALLLSDCSLQNSSTEIGAGDYDPCLNPDAEHPPKWDDASKDLPPLECDQ